LPIELKVLQTLKQEERKALTPIALRKSQRIALLKPSTINAKALSATGVWADWEKALYHLDPFHESRPN
jgi:isoleucyl-tRNA synthetase